MNKGLQIPKLCGKFLGKKQKWEIKLSHSCGKYSICKDNVKTFKKYLSLPKPSATIYSLTNINQRKQNNDQTRTTSPARHT
jgi:hypothetical protein